MRRRLLAAANLLLGLTLAPALAMDNPGAFTLGDFQIGANGTQCTPPLTNNNGLAGLPGLQGLNAVTLQARFLYGTGGGQTNVYVLTSIDQGQTWFDVAAFQFTTASGTDLVNLSGLDKVTTPATPTYLQLTPGTVVDGPLGDRLMACEVSTGSAYAGTLLSVRGVAR